MTYFKACLALFAMWLMVQSGTALPAIYIERDMKVARGVTLESALRQAGLPSQQAHIMAARMPDAARRMTVGTTMTLRYAEGSRYEIAEGQVVYRPKAGLEATLNVESPARVLAQLTEKPLVTRNEVAVGRIRGSLWEDATNAGLPAQLVKPFVDLFAWDVDFTREIKPGDTFKVMFEETRDDRGNLVKTGRILGAELFAKGNRRAAFYFESNGRGEYFNEKGQTKRKLLLRTPLEVFRISSGFGKRFHPVLGYSRMHKGTDFAAPTGTPIKASGDGVVTYVGWHGGHGKYIQIKHNGTYSTAYGHMSAFARGVRVGSRVRQSQIIGYVGSTGVSTGPHLHYEVMRNMAQVDPMNTNLPTGIQLAGKDMKRFKARVGEAQVAWTKAAQTVEVAMR